MRILVADDEPEMTMVLEALLSREHYSVDVVHDGQDALDYGLAENYGCASAMSRRRCCCSRPKARSKTA